MHMEPPNSSLVIFFPKALSTTAGPATSSWAVFLVITLKWEATNLAAGKPATGPKAADITGISLRFPLLI
ncbi:MAG: hypothetical protein CM1200mP12_10420 [Gammaproteobacteria bacterium]|nr:MAG: hypothetical protein CM1200mP12_10420 [Gammaproteobacteria bacterium]